LLHCFSISAMLAVAACAGEVTQQPCLVERSRVSMGSELTLSAWTTNESRGVSRSHSSTFRELIA
jgi:hypothetical protein